MPVRPARRLLATTARPASRPITARAVSRTRRTRCSATAPSLGGHVNPPLPTDVEPSTPEGACWNDRRPAPAGDQVDAAHGRPRLAQAIADTTRARPGRGRSSSSATPYPARRSRPRRVTPRGWPIGEVASSSSTALSRSDAGRGGGDTAGSGSQQATAGRAASPPARPGRRRRQVSVPTSASTKPRPPGVSGINAAAPAV